MNWIKQWWGKKIVYFTSITGDLRLSLRRERVGRRVKRRSLGLGGHRHADPHPLQLAQAIRKQARLWRVLQLLPMPWGRSAMLRLHFVNMPCSKDFDVET